MIEHTSATSPQVYARTAGALYLVIIVCGIFSEVFVRGSLIVMDDASATATNIIASEGLFRLGFVSDTLVFLSDVALAVLFYVLLRPVNPTLSLMAAAFRLTQTAIIGLNLLNHYAALMILNGTDQLAAFNSEQLHALVLLFLNAHAHGYDLGLLFFGVNSVVVGYLVWRAPYFPKALGGLLIAAGAVYLMGSYLRFIVPDVGAAFTPAYGVALIAELAMCLWLLIKGVDVPRWQEA
ncbi:DUF4386 domain-containing protein [Magnetovibrio sp.]|uniref:DUF4386 domain-containing protein n=1 Tax=Magnetovibrio sp. TaxID=2024836 RepID=UPI002F958086